MFKVQQGIRKAIKQKKREEEWEKNVKNTEYL